MWTTTTIERDGVRLACHDSGGPGPVALLLHGLAGQSGEWEPLARLLRGHYRLIALDQRGHGRSEPRPADTSRAAFTADVAAVISGLGVGPVILAGQSLGGVTALQAAAARPDLVRALLLVEAGAEAGGPELPGQIAGWLDSWPRPFAGRRDAVAFFGGGRVGEGWATGLVAADGGLGPAFDRDTLVNVITDHTRRANWAAWSGLTCPVSVLLGERGVLPAQEVAEMRRLLPRARFVTVPGAGHDVHLERPDETARELHRLARSGALVA
ncbi:alpha/beta hydrolase [Nonomuraea sp. NN258]|uniref:alpha/beta fold hydrolase n=1 Tax=Nonomuraea antri TaxID=2730852 RepID=UPI001567F591|nr:alpha/beta hydrolase [Nonomuraea antri]NRQ39858.1 alpha/beta hydrolase [Nonomuraea antri]